MDADVLQSVLGRPVAPECVRPARLSGFRRVTVLGRTYPMLLPHPLSCVDGQLIFGLGIVDFRRLDRYEGREYRLGAIHVQGPDGQDCAALAYFCRQGIATDGRPWSP